MSVNQIEKIKAKALGIEGDTTTPVEDDILFLILALCEVVEAQDRLLTQLLADKA